jgi:hypothetical protein
MASSYMKVNKEIKPTNTLLKQIYFYKNVIIITIIIIQNATFASYEN